MLKALLVAGAVVASTAPTFAQDYYVVRSGDDDNCEVIETQPTGSYVQIGPIAFATREEAEKELTVLCENEDGEEVIIKERQ
jgi:hypothetical protein